MLSDRAVHCLRGCQCLVLAAGLGLWGWAGAERLVVGGEDGYEPYESLDANGEPTGFNVELMRAIAEAVDAQVVFELGSWEEVRGRLMTGEIDVLGMFVSAERARTVAFANPHVIVHHRIFIPADRPPIFSLQELAGKHVIVQRAAYSHEFLAQADIDARLTLVDSDSEALHLLARGEHDAALLTEHRSRFTLRRGELDQLTVSGPPVLPVEYAFAVHRDNADLLLLINTGLERVTASGQFDQIYERWLQPYDGRIESPMRNGMLLAAIALVVLLAGLAVWQKLRLRRARAEQAEALQQIEYLRGHDALTGVSNRLAFEQTLSRCLSNEPESRQQRHVLMSMNVDQFRLVNENLGHAAGDRVLGRIAALLVETLGHGARIGRLGSDEFAALLPNTGTEQAMALGERLLEEIRQVDAGKGVKLGLSIGLVPFDGRHRNVAQLLGRADCACLAAKEDGGNRVHVWHSEDRRLAEQVGLLRWVGRIQAALAEDRLLPYFQPIVRAEADIGEYWGVEILVRLQSPDGRIIPAGMFMPAAERYFLSTEIDRWMVKYMLDWLQVHPQVAHGLERININLSGRSLGDQRFLDFLTRSLLEAQPITQRLCFEITETALIANLILARKALLKLRGSGCRFALDDFGSGLSSMTYLKQLPVDFLKIDGGFVRDIEHDEAALNMIREINRLGHAIGKTTIAECVESDTIRHLLRDVGVDLLQGFGIGRPAPLGELLHWCQQRSTATTRKSG